MRFSRHWQFTVAFVVVLALPPPAEARWIPRWVSGCGAAIVDHVMSWAPETAGGFLLSRRGEQWKVARLQGPDIDLANQHLRSPELVVLAPALGQAQTLVLNYNRSLGAWAIARVLAQNANLRELDISRTRDGARVLQRKGTLAALQELRWLKVSHARDSDLVEAAKLPELRTLEVHDGRIRGYFGWGGLSMGGIRRFLDNPPPKLKWLWIPDMKNRRFRELKAVAHAKGIGLRVLPQADEVCTPIDCPLVRDGDTLNLDLLGEAMASNGSVGLRIRGIDAGETPTTKPLKERALGLAAKQRLVELTANVDHLEVLNVGPDKYNGRLVGDVYVDGKLVADILLTEGLAVRYEGDTKKADWAAMYDAYDRAALQRLLGATAKGQEVLAKLGR